jgi:hypothetical protein
MIEFIVLYYYKLYDKLYYILRGYIYSFTKLITIYFIADSILRDIILYSI